MINADKQLFLFIIIGLMVLCPGISQAQEIVEQPDEDFVESTDSMPFKDEQGLSEDGVVDETIDDEVTEEPEAEDSEKDIDNQNESDESEPQPVKSTKVDMKQLITLDLRGMDVTDALTYISLRSGANIVSSKTVTGRVTLQLKDVPLQDVFDITLLTNDLAYEKIGDIFYIMTGKEYEARYGKKFSDIRQVKMFQLQYAIPEKAFDLLDTLKSSIGRILVDQQSGAVLMVDTQEKIDEMLSALATLEQKSDVTIFELQYALAQDVEEQLRGQLNDMNVGSIWSDERNNQVIIQALPERMEDIKNIIAALDKKTREVLIDTKIVKIQIKDSIATGFEWEGMFQQLFDAAGGGFLGSHAFEPVERLNKTFIDDFTTIQPDDENPSAGSKKVFGEEIFFGTTNPNHSFEVLMKFLATLGETRLISNPKIAVINNEEARIHVGRQLPYVTSTKTTGTSTETTAEDITFVNIGIQLSVTPKINAEGYITMKIRPEVSSKVGDLPTPSGNLIPIIDTSLAETTVMVKDNATIIIGGLRREEEKEDAKRIPFFGDLPILGTIFRSQTKSTERSELIVMITPHIVDADTLSTGDIDEPGRETTKSFKDYATFDSISETYGPEFGALEYKSFRD